MLPSISRVLKSNSSHFRARPLQNIYAFSFHTIKSFGIQEQSLMERNSRRLSYKIDTYVPFLNCSPKRSYTTSQGIQGNQPLISGKQNAFKFTYNHLELRDTIPRLPIPDIEHTLQQYLFYLQPLVSEESYEITKGYVEQFLKGGDAHMLQKDLQRLNQESSTSWLEGFWDSMYLDLRCPLPLNVSPFIVLRDQKVEGDPQIGRAANLMHSVAVFHTLIQNGTLPHDTIGKLPLDMSQYRNLFSTSRIPLQGRDTLIKYPDSKHIVVLSNSNFFSLPIISESGDPISEAKIYEQLQQIRDASSKRKPSVSIGTLTTEDREVWSDIRRQLAKSNSSSFEAIDSAITILVLDATEHKSREELARSIFHATENRWYDKTQFIVARDGSSGINMEHTGYDGHTLMTFIHYYWNIHGTSKDTLAPKDSNNSSEKFSSIMWNIPSELHSTITDAIVNAKARSEAICSVIDCTKLLFKDFGSSRMKECKVSPDAFVQMAFQLAYYRVYGTTVSTYESANTKFFYHGRTETVRSASLQSRAFTEAFDLASISKKKKIDLFREACTQHVDTLKKCQQGSGVDRHLFALNRLAKQRRVLFPGYEIPKIFTDGNYTLFGSNILSTSNVSTPDMELFGFGPVHPKGYGIGYSIQSNDIVFYITNYEEQSKKLTNAIEKALQDISSLFE